MSSSAIIHIQENLQYPPLKKIDPNTQQVPKMENEPTDQSFGQAAIPSILASFCNYVESDEGALTVLNNHQQKNCLKTIFGQKQQEAIGHISDYSGQSSEYTLLHLQAIAKEVVKIVKEQLPENAVAEDIKDFFKNEKNDILTYLPAEIQLGKLLDDDSLDDETNKMTGGLSGLVHSIGSAFVSTKEKEKLPEEPEN